MKLQSKKLCAILSTVSVIAICVGIGCQTVSDAAEPVVLDAVEEVEQSAKELAIMARNTVLEAGYDSLDLELFNNSERFFLTAADSESEGAADDANENYQAALDGYQQLIQLGKTAADRLRALADAEYQEALNEERITEEQFEAILQDGLGQPTDSPQLDAGDSLLLDDIDDMDNMKDDDMDDMDKMKDDDMADMDDMKDDDMDDMDKMKDDDMDDMDKMKDDDMDDMDKMKDDDMADMDDMKDDDMADMDDMKDDDMDDMKEEADESESEVGNDA